MRSWHDDKDQQAITALGKEWEEETEKEGLKMWRKSQEKMEECREDNGHTHPRFSMQTCI